MRIQNDFNMKDYRIASFLIIISVFLSGCPEPLIVDDVHVIIKNGSKEKLVFAFDMRNEVILDTSIWKEFYWGAFNKILEEDIVYPDSNSMHGWPSSNLKEFLHEPINFTVGIGFKFHEGSKLPVLQFYQSLLYFW